MDRTDKERYFIVGSTFMEVVTPLFRERLGNDYSGKGFASLENFINDQPIKHTLYHLRHRNNYYCCIDNTNCVSNHALPLNYHQWDLLFTENLGQSRHYCFCKYTAKPIKLEDLDVTMSSVILLNCCSLCPVEEHAIRSLRQYKNDYMSHNRKGKVDHGEYITLWTNLKGFILQLDPSKEDELKRLENRPLDESLCNKYNTCLLDLHQKLDEMESKICTGMQEILNHVKNSQCNKRKPETAEKASQYMEHAKPYRQGKKRTNPTNQISTVSHSINKGTIKPYRLGQDIFTLHQQYETTLYLYITDEPYRLGQDIFTLQHQYNLESVVYSYYIVFLSSVLNVGRIGQISGGVMMDDGRLVICLFAKKRLLICNTDGSEGDSIPLQSRPFDVTAVNNSTVAVTLPGSHCIENIQFIDQSFSCIEMYNINNKYKLKSIPVPSRCMGITTINNKLVVGCEWSLLMIDDQTGEVVHTVYTDCSVPFRLHTTGDRIFYRDGNNINYNLYCYSYTDDRVTTLTLPSKPQSITSLQDGSLYVVCRDGSVQHVSSDGLHYKPVKTKGLKSQSLYSIINYNPNQRKLMICGQDGIQIFNKKI